MRARLLFVSLALVAASVLTGCGGSSESSGSSGEDRVVVATHDSWAAPKELIAKFEKESGLKVVIRPQGDAGTLTNKLVLTKGSPIADAVFGIDNTFASRAVEEKVLARNRLDRAPSFALDGQDAEYLTPVDYGDVCVNLDDTWFADKGIAPPTGLADLVKPAYKDLMVVPGASTSSPGMAFLLATIGAMPDGWQDYWRALVANGVKVVSGWSDAYEVDFTAGGGKGDRPIVVSYSSSPPFTVPEGGDRPTTSALLDTCFRQVEYAGVLAGAKNPEGAEKFLDFLRGKDFQASLPENMYVYPVDPTVSLPEEWAKWAPPSPKPVEVPAAQITEHRTEWLREWRDIATG